MNQEKIENQSFVYPLFFRIIFRFGNFFITAILISYTIPLLFFLNDNLIFALPLLLNLSIVYFLNRHYFILYKILPYSIEADNEKIVCSNFFLSKKEIRIFYEDVTRLSGGIFDGKLSGIMKVYDGKNNLYFGFYSKLNKSSNLAAIILNKVRQDIYDDALEKIKSGKWNLKK